MLPTNPVQMMQAAADPAQIEQRIKELQVIKFWLEQNLTMVDSSISALDLQKKSIELLKQNPFLNAVDPMKAIFNPMQMWMDGAKAIGDAFTATANR